ncbi:MAG TPA: BlaI/MecI/CopY family transcriptional regulator [Thermoplasmata archaeon]|nr:BlaI/MecI/CopY family transcriptional regulator [Thermoplasmata archaeon]
MGSLETEVLRALGSLRSAPARRIKEELDRRGVRVAYTTIATTLSRLHGKGLVRRTSESCRGGERFVYAPVDFERKYLANVVKSVVRLFGPTGVVHLSEELAKLNPAEERELRRRLRL